MENASDRYFGCRDDTWRNCDVLCDEVIARDLSDAGTEAETVVNSKALIEF